MSTQSNYSAARHSLRDARRCRERGDMQGYYWWLAVARCSRREARLARYQTRFVAEKPAEVVAKSEELRELLAGEAAEEE